MPRLSIPLVLAGAFSSACGSAGPPFSDTDATTSQAAGTDSTDGATHPATESGESGEVDESCAFAGDGVCDEPGNCALGTDEADCAAACESGENLHLHAAACAFRDPPTPPPDDGRGSAGNGGLTGTFDRTVLVPNGESSGEVARHYRLVVPKSYDPGRSIPLVIVMPGHRVSHFSLPTYTGLLRAADHNQFLVVFAEQQWRTTSEPRWSWWTDWNWGANAQSNPDIAYLVAVINAVAAEYDVDLRRIYTAGHSRGAAMAFIAALELSDYIAGACVQSGFTEFGYLDARLSSWSGRKVPMYFMHGIQDPDVPVAASDTMVQRLLDLGWTMDEDVVYRRLDGVGHRWQPWLDQQWWDFLSARPLPE